jgi:hypothetical protein
LKDGVALAVSNVEALLQMVVSSAATDTATLQERVVKLTVLP